DDPGLEVHDVRRILRVGEVMGEPAVRFTVELDDLAADAAQELRRVEPGDTVARVDHDREASREADHPAQRGEVVVAGALRVEGPVALLEVAALGERAEELDLLLREWRRAPVDHLHAVVRDRVVAPRDVGSAVELPVRGGEVEDRRRHEAAVHQVDDALAPALHERTLKERTKRTAQMLFHTLKSGTGFELWKKFDKDLARELSMFFTGVLYSREVLSQKQRELCAVAALTALHRPNEVRAHLHA